MTLGDVLFDSGQDRMLPESASYMSRLAEAFKRNPSLKASIEGHTDSIGTSAFNVELSERRAKTVKDALISHGVLANQLSTQGLGEGSPAASNDTPAGRQMNRRVEIIFTPISGVSISR